MDGRDLLLIKYLSLDARTTLKTLGAKIALSQEATGTRIQKLFDQKYVVPYALINFHNIGKKNVYLQIKFDNYDISSFNLLLQTLASHPAIGWLAETFHAFDIVLSIIYSVDSTIEEIITLIKEAAPRKIKKLSQLYFNSVFYFSF